jgi:hypothetical protein
MFFFLTDLEGALAELDRGVARMPTVPSLALAPLAKHVVLAAVRPKLERIVGDSACLVAHGYF